ncbi:MAG: hypothetical protein L0191_19285, partial [Acidobacteria bacterium]|nr:hypothetical protein [Acidobacteriota bacterium]
ECERSYHVDTWDGASWVERAVRARGPNFETDQVDLSAYLPDVDGEYKVRLRQTGPSPAELDYTALNSAGALLAPVEADFGGVNYADVLAAPDNQVLFLDGSEVILRFPAAPGPSFVFRAREGTPTACLRETFWQRDVPLNLAPGAVLDAAEALGAPVNPQQYVLSGRVLTRDGAVLAGKETPFEVVSLEGFSVSLRTEESLYRIGTQVPVTGTVRNFSAVDEAALRLSVYRKDDAFTSTLIHQESFGLAAGEERSYSFSAESVSEEMNLQAVVDRGGVILATSDWTFAGGSPNIDSAFRVPDPLLRLVPTSSRLVEAQEADLDAVGKTDNAAVFGALPFQFTIGGITYGGFRQSDDGFVELIPQGATPGRGCSSMP